MRQLDITVLMVRPEQVVPVVWGKFLLKLGREVLGDSQVNVTRQVLATMGEWVRVGLPKGVQEQAQVMEREEDHVLKAGLEVKREV